MIATALLQLILFEPTRADDAKPDECGIASVYSTLSEETASGQDTSVNDRTAAHRSLTFGTLVRVDNQETGSRWYGLPIAARSSVEKLMIYRKSPHMSSVSPI